MKNGIVFALLLSAMPAMSGASEVFEVSGTGSVYRVSDGDTMWITGIEQDAYNRLWNASRDERHFNHYYRSIKMRVGGINTAESNHKDKSRNTEEGRASSRYLKGIVHKNEADFTCWTIGNYGRPICMIDLEGIGDVGLHMIEQGHTEYFTKYGLHPYLDREYRKAQW